MVGTTVCYEIVPNPVEFWTVRAANITDLFPRRRKAPSSGTARLGVVRHVADARTLSHLAGASLPLKDRIHHRQPVHKPH
jgi:hypothetical protein